jgi:hypothetical protein
MSRPLSVTDPIGTRIIFRSTDPVDGEWMLSEMVTLSAVRPYVFGPILRVRREPDDGHVFIVSADRCAVLDSSDV